jgi:acyl dehydratase
LSGRDITAGRKFRTDKWRIEETDIIEFAAKYDPQPIHMDSEFAAKNSLFGQIVASGFMTISVAWGLWIKSGIPGTDQRAGISLDKVRWFNPVVTGDELYADIEVLSVRKSSKLDMNVTTLYFLIKNQREEPVLEFTSTGLTAI